MTLLASPSVHPYGLLLAADSRAEGWSSALRTAARRGDVTRVRPGVYLPTPLWHSLPPHEQYLARIHAVALTFTRPVFSHQSAAARHGLPLLAARLTRLHLIQTTPHGSGTRGDATVHAFAGDPDIVERGGLLLTSVPRTVWDLARTLPHGEALAIADAAIRPGDVGSGTRGTGAALCTKSELLERAAASVAQRGGWSAYLVASAADPRSGSVGESVARSTIIRLGAPMPDLQVPFHDRDGLIGYSDFFWPAQDTIGEFDGRMKYGADNPSGEDPSVVVYREKLREDRLRRVASRVVRFGWREVNDPPRLAALLRSAGIPLERAAAWRELRPALRGLPPGALRA